MGEVGVGCGALCFNVTLLWQMQCGPWHMVRTWVAHESGQPVTAQGGVLVLTVEGSSLSERLWVCAHYLSPSLGDSGMAIAQSPRVNPETRGGWEAPIAACLVQFVALSPWLAL